MNMELNLRNLGRFLLVISVLLFIFLILIKINFDEQGAYLCETVDKATDLDMVDCPAHNNPTSWIIFIAFGVVFLVFGAGIYLLISSIKREKTDQKVEEKKDFTQIDLSSLDEEEKKIYELLKFNKGSMYQSDLVKEMGFTKVKTTRILDRMENHEILERKRRGMTNIIVLK